MELWAALEYSDTGIITRIEDKAAWYIGILATGGYVFTQRTADGLEGLVLPTKAALLEHMGEKNARAKDWQPCATVDLSI